jgi:hypothetical protein
MVPSVVLQEGRPSADQLHPNGPIGVIQTGAIGDVHTSRRR